MGRIWVSFYSVFWGMLLDRSVTIFLGAKGAQQGPQTSNLRAVRYSDISSLSLCETQ